MSAIRPPLHLTARTSAQFGSHVQRRIGADSFQRRAPVRIPSTPAFGAFAPRRAPRNATHLAASSQPAESLPAALFEKPETAAAMCEHLVQTGQTETLDLLLSAAGSLPNAVRVAMVEGLQRAGWAQSPWPLLQNPPVPLHALSVQALVWLVRKAPTADVGGPDVRALQSLRTHFGDSTDLQALVRAWKTQARVPALTETFNRVGADLFDKLAVEQLARRCTAGLLTPQGLLLGIHLIELLGPARLQHPRVQQLLTSQYIVRDHNRLRRVLVALRGLSEHAMQKAAQHAQGVLVWPGDADLRDHLHDRVQDKIASHRDAWQSWRSGDLDRPALRTCLESLKSTLQLAVDHAQHLHAGLGDAGKTAVAETYQTDTFAQAHAALGQTFQVMVPPPEVPEAGQQLWQNFVQQAKATPLGGKQGRAAVQALLNWAAQGSRLEGDAGEWVHQVRTLALRWQKLSEAAHRLHSPNKAPLPARDFLKWSAAHSHVQKFYSETVQQAQISGLEGLLATLSFGGNPEFKSPEQLAGRAALALQLNATQMHALVPLLQSFRRQHLFWKFASMMRGHDPHLHGKAFHATLRAVLDGPDAYNSLRRQTPQMQRLFADGQRNTLLHAWEAGAQAPLLAPGAELFPAGAKLCDTAHFADLVSSGDEVKNSCQSLNNSDYAHYLMGRVVCGSKRMVSVQGPDQSLLARAKLRLMLGPHGEPVLLLSQTYAAHADMEPAAEEQFKAFALQRGRALGLPVYSCFYGELANNRHGADKPGLEVHHFGGDFQEYWDETAGAGRDAFTAWRLTD